MNRRIPKLPTDRLLTRADVQRLVDACDRPRDRALLMLLWDSGARISEIVTLDIGHVEFDRYGAVVIVNGKTGRRRVRLIAAAPELQTWLNQHPLKTNAAAPLFTTYNRYAAGTKRLAVHTIQNTLKTIARRAGVTKPVHPHAFRHARLTDLAKQGFSEMELRIIAGWEKNSAMPEVYIHLSGGDVERKMLQKAGFVTGDETPGTAALEPRQCPRCRTMNTYDALYCRACSMALTEHAAYQVEEKTGEAEKSDEYQDLLKRLKRDLGVNL
jgi:integrase